MMLKNFLHNQINKEEQVMPTIKQQPVPEFILPVFKRHGIKIKNYRTPTAFERDLKKFLKRNHILHLSTCNINTPRSTPLEYRLNGLTFYILSEGGGKFNNLMKNKKVSFSIAEPYNSEKDFWGSKGLQAWGKARVHSLKENPIQFKDALKKMKLTRVLKKLGMQELPDLNFRIIEITPDRIKYGNPREGVYKVTWERNALKS
jgi:hypothetical protein